MTSERSVQYVLRLALATTLATLALGAAAAAAAAKQQTYPTADAAAAALVAAAKAEGTDALLEVLGPDAKTLVSSGDPVADQAARERFVESYEEAHELVAGPDDTTILQTGKDKWPLPIPLVDTDQGWRFDTVAGRDEMITRRIGANELDTIETVRAYVDAQREYHDRNPQKEKIAPYAQLIASSKGKQDGLYWDTQAGETPSPLGELFASARGEGYQPGQGKPMPYHGYYYRILKAQGPHAPGGAYDYVVRGKMIGGFALVAYPAEYDSTGVMTFLVNHEGQVYEKNLGPKTAQIAQAMTKFDPDDTWRKVGAGPGAPPASSAQEGSAAKP